MLEVVNLEFEYPDRSLLDNINFCVNPGTLLHLRGSNGAGKTTLLKLLAGLLQPGSGNIYFNRKDIHRILPTYHQSLSYLGHKPGINLQLTIEENCRYTSFVALDKVHFHTLLYQFSLQDMAQLPCHLLSAGQRRKVALLRIILSQSRLWLLDEPFVALDRHANAMFMDILAQQLAQQGIIILTSHQKLSFKDMQVEEYDL